MIDTDGLLQLEETSTVVPRLPLNDTLLTILLLSDQPILAVDGSIRGRGAPRDGEPSCFLVRVEEKWSHA